MHLRSLISAFDIQLLESIISKLATSVFSFFLLVSVAEETGLSLALSEPPQTDLSRRGPIKAKIVEIDDKLSSKQFITDFCLVAVDLN